MRHKKIEPEKQIAGPGPENTGDLPQPDGEPSESVVHNAILLNQNLFKGIPRHLLEPVLHEYRVRQVQQGEILIASGEENHYLYLLVAGQLQVCLDTADSQTHFSIDPGECVGEMSIIDGKPTSAYVIAEEDSTLLVLPDTVFWDKFIHLPGAVRNLLQLLTNRMRKDNQNMLRTLEQRLRYEHLQKELAAAGKIQANILPQEIPLLPHHPQVEVVATLEPASEVGGDFYDAFALDRDTICVAIGDVSGKGMPAALFMVRVVTLLRMSLSRDKPIELVLPSINQILCENNADCMFVTLFVGVFNVSSGRLTYVNGGHNPPFFSRANQPFKPLAVPKGILLGVLEGAQYKAATLQFRPGDTIVLYTDGVTEAENTNQELFSEARAGEVLNSIGSDADITATVKSLEDAVLQFSKGQPQSDDITMLALRYRGAQPH